MAWGSFDEAMSSFFRARRCAAGPNRCRQFGAVPEACRITSSRPVIDIFRVVDAMPEDELAAAFHLLAHQFAEQLLGLLSVVERHLQQGPLGGIKRCRPQFLG